ncbi:MAG: hypothetical protein ACI4VQ_05770 [Clostridia bacterium]
MEIEIKEKLAHFEERLNHSEKNIEDLDERLKINEKMVMEMDKSLSISMKQIENIAENLKQTSINFKEAVMRSNTANAKDTEILKEKYKELDQKIEKVNEKLEKETTGKDAENWRSSKKQIWSWILNAILLIVATALGISKFL